MDYISAGRIYMLDVGFISTNPSQPRKYFEEEAIERLAESISIYGILQPLTVRKISSVICGNSNKNTENNSLTQKKSSDSTPASQKTAKNISEIIRGNYEIIAGERRLRAAIKLGMEKVPCIIIEADDKKSAELAIIENIQRENLNIFEQAGAIASLIDIYGLTQEQVAKQLSSSQSYVANKLRILRLTAPERDMIISCSLTERHARSLLRINDIKLRFDTLKYIAEKQLNVASTEAYIDKLLTTPDKPETHRTQKFILKDIRIFFNTIDHAVDLVRSAGIDIVSERNQCENEIELLIRVKNERPMQICG